MAILNFIEPRLIEENIILDWDDIPLQHLKYKPLNPENYHKLDKNAQFILDKMMPFCQDGYKSTVFDYKVFSLRANDCGCKLEGWHIDVTRNPNHSSRLDNHLIYTTVSGTEFMLTEIPTLEDDFAKVDMQGKYFQAKPNSIYQYNRLNVHRGPIMQEDCKRVLIRLTQTDVF